MAIFSELDLIQLLLSLGALLLLVRLFDYSTRRLGLPLVIGEILLGILVGPTFLGSVFPEVSHWLFPLSGNAAIVIQGLISLAVLMLLFVAGMDVNLKLIKTHGRAVLSTSLASMVIPFLFGFYVVWLFPHTFFFQPEHQWIFAAFFGTAMAISALPVIIRILMDLGIYQTKLGMIIISSAVINDLVGWIAFSIILSLTVEQNNVNHPVVTVLLILGFVALVLTLGRWVLKRAVPWIQTRSASSDSVLSLCVALCFLGASITASIGVHALLGAFMVGVAFGDCKSFRQKARENLQVIVTQVFAPLFFISIGIKVNFIQYFDFPLISLVLVIAIGGKLLGALLGAKLGGLTRAEGWVVGYGLNARGAMEIILGTLALNTGLIDAKLFVALVVMALVTSLISGPLMKRMLVKLPSPEEELPVSAQHSTRTQGRTDRSNAAKLLRSTHQPDDPAGGF